MKNKKELLLAALSLLAILAIAVLLHYWNPYKNREQEPPPPVTEIPIPSSSLSPEPGTMVEEVDKEIIEIYTGLFREYEACIKAEKAAKAQREQEIASLKVWVAFGNLGTIHELMNDAEVAKVDELGLQFPDVIMEVDHMTTFSIFQNGEWEKIKADYYADLAKRGLTVERLVKPQPQSLPITEIKPPIRAAISFLFNFLLRDKGRPNLRRWCARCGR